MENIFGLRANLYCVSYKVKGDTAVHKVTFPVQSEAQAFIKDYSWHIRTGLITDMSMRVV